jgi:hypothetical protein
MPKQTKTSALQDKLATQENKLKVFKSRPGPSWKKAITRTENFIAQIKAELDKPAKTTAKKGAK